MKYITGFFSALLFSGNLFAANLCDSSCDLSITFPDGGSIEAIEPLTIIFGVDGYIINSEGYSSENGEISLTTGELMEFQAGGELVLGVDGNIDYSNVQITSNGTMNLAAVGGAKTVSIQDLTLLGACTLSISSDFEVVEGGSFHLFSGLVTATADLVFSNYGSVSGLFDFEAATLTLDKTIYEIDSSILIEADGMLEMTSEEVVIETVALSTDSGGSDVPPASTDSSATGASSGGLINIFSLLFISLLLVSARLLTIRGRCYR